MLPVSRALAASVALATLFAIENANAQVYAQRCELYNAQANPNYGFGPCVTLQPGETRIVTFPLAGSALAYWDPDAHRWVVETGPVVLEVGASSADIRLEKTVMVAGQL